MSKTLRFKGDHAFVVGRGRYSAADGDPTDTGGSGPSGPPVYAPPVFPDFTTMSCDQLAAQIKIMISAVSSPPVSTGTKDIVQAYNNAISQAQALYSTKGCSTGSPIIVNNPPLPVGTIPVAIDTMLPGGFGGGGGGSDAGKAPAKKPFPWLLAILGAGLAYMIFRKK